MTSIDRRNVIKAGLIGASLSTLPMSNAAAQSGRVAHSGHRVVSRDSRVFGLSSMIVTDLERDDIPEPTNADKVERNGELDYVTPVARLLEASFNNSPTSLNDFTGEEFYSEVDRILENENNATQILMHPDSRFYWAQVNPWFLVVIVPRGAVTWIAAGASIWTLRPFVDGFLDEAGRDVWRWMTDLLP